MTESKLWRVRLTVPQADLDTAEAAFGDTAVSVSWFEGENSADWQIDALFDTMPDRAVLERQLAALGDGKPDLSIEPVPDVDWLAENRKSFPAVTVGRFFIHRSDDTTAAPSGATSIALDAGAAFGSGTHASTRGCLMALESAIRQSERPPARALDLGCGSGILAIAMARGFGIPVIAADNDAIAVEVARRNALANGVGELVSAVESDGTAAPAVAQCAPFDLISANILAGPLIDLAPDIAAILSDTGDLVLSGILADQNDAVEAAYAAAELTTVDRIRLQDWVTLRLSRAA